SMLNAESDALTLSLKLMTTLEPTETPVAPLTGVVLMTPGAASPPPHGAGAVAEFRAAGVAAAKSVLLLSVSVHPAPARCAESELLSVGAGPAPSKHSAVFDPYPTKSTMDALDGQPPVKAVVADTSATLAFVWLMLKFVPTTSAAGSGAPVAPPASRIRR